MNEAALVALTFLKVFRVVSNYVSSSAVVFEQRCPMMT